MFVHKEFLSQFGKYNREEKDSRKEISGMSCKPGEPVFLCEEPVKFLHETDDFSNNKIKCQKDFENRKTNFRQVPVNKAFGETIWFNTTRRGINLRPGINKNGFPRAVTMGDDGVHGLIAGQTGSGKSVLLNNLIFNMLMEYAPWELDLYLADFKRVEFSRYMSGYKTPHVCVCAATSEVRYVLSLISYLVDCMNAREEFFARLGLTKISEFRDRYPNVVLPRMLLIVDEFQQLFLEANPKEGDQIRQMLTAVVKKGRATGLHILFASQEISQTLSRSDLANFRLRFALNCTAGTSVDVIGNRGAVTLKKGQVIYNTSEGTEEKNTLYNVPFIETEEKEGGISYFDEYLKSIHQTAESIGFHKVQKFYKEELQEPFRRLEEILNDDRIKSERKKHLREESQKYFDILTLGPYVTYSNRQYDIQSLFLEYGRNRNILAVSPKAEDLTYLERLLRVNFDTSPKGEILGTEYHHEIFSFQSMIPDLFSSGIIHTNPDDIIDLEEIFLKKRMLFHLLRECRTPYEFALENYRANLNLQSRSYSAQEREQMEEQTIPILEKLFGTLAVEEIPKACEKIHSGAYSDVEKTIAENLLNFYQYQKNPYAVFPPTVYWFIGIDSIERIPEWFFMTMKDGMDYNMLFIVMANAEFDQMTQMARYCDYTFAGGSNQRIYERLQMNYTYRQSDSIVLDLNIKSIGEERSFKKYKQKFERKKAPSIDFDKVFGEEQLS